LGVRHIFLGLSLSLAVASPVLAQGDLPGLLLEHRTASVLGIAVRDTVWVSGLEHDERPFVVAGLYRRPADPSTVTLRDYRAIFHLPDLQELLGGSDRVDRFTIKQRPGADREAVIAEIDRLAFGADALPTETVATATSETFRVVARFHRALAGITITGAAVFLLCLVVLKLEERRLEGASMRDVGVSRRTLFLWTFSETTAMAVVGTVAGLLIGWGGAWIINAYFRGVYDTGLAFAKVTPRLATLVGAIGLATGLVVGILAGLQMVRSSSMRLRQP
jgi:putative ABC transport system permease protein